MPLEDESQRKATILVPREHPAIPGHFPGNPVVPAVLILHELILATRCWLGPDQGIHRLEQAKFLAPLRPDEEAVIELARRGDAVHFSVHRGPVVIAKGAFGLEPASGS
jgi:3-hydroxymyristoyl/3-hydroxydecanoyl-(acyl carrier protein) dehydratase